MQKPADQCRIVHAKLCKDDRNAYGMDKIRFSALSQLSVMKLSAFVVGFPDKPGVVFGIDIQYFF